MPISLCINHICILIILNFIGFGKSYASESYTPVSEGETRNILCQVKVFSPIFHPHSNFI